MNSFWRCIVIALLLPSSLLVGQQTNFDIDTYKIFLTTHQDLTSGQLVSMHPAGVFEATSNVNPLTAPYYDLIDARYHFTEGEKTLLQNHGFFVTERLSYPSFGNALTQIYNYDLPVFVSTDAILHPLHTSYDALLQEVEFRVLVPSIDTLLSRLHSTIPFLAERYASSDSMETMLKDLDVYLAVPRLLLGKSISPFYVENTTTVNELLTLIQELAPQKYALFSSTQRTIDFSQFQVRGHYSQDPLLGKYFQAMIWLGRTEIYLTAPESDDPEKQTQADIQRQVILALLVTEAAESANTVALVDSIDSVLRLFVGDQDNVTLSNLFSLRTQLGIQSASELLDTLRFQSFRALLLEQSYAFQRINSQILMSDPMDPDQIQTASAFLLFGQRFIVDSYVTWNVVFDRIIFNGQKVRRMLPDPLDIMFAIGNNAAGQLMQTEIDNYHYAPNLAALRYLIDSYDSLFWYSSFYNGWLNAIRTLNPPEYRTMLPAFMQTAAWWQEKLNTQLASWAQLRHDNLLYAKQSYSGGVICSFPESYVEPIPEFYHAISQFSLMAEEKLAGFNIPTVSSFFHNFSLIADTLSCVAVKELAHTTLSEAEKLFLKSMLRPPDPMCGSPYTGWYTKLYFQLSAGAKDMFDQDYVVADVHTAPTDEYGNPVGWVLHGGTGPINLAIISAELSDGTPCTFAGPVMSYYEHISTNFKRLTDEEWKTMYALSPSLRPPFAYLYLADDSGSFTPNAPSLVTTDVKDRPTQNLPSTLVLRQNYPNPFNSSTLISFVVPLSLAHSTVTLRIFNVQGELVSELIQKELPAGNYITRWEGATQTGKAVASGVYFYHLIVGNQRLSGRMMLLK